MADRYRADRHPLAFDARRRKSHAGSRRLTVRDIDGVEVLPDGTSGSGSAPPVQSYEPGEDWWYCYIDDLVFLFDAAPSFAHS